MTSTVGSDLLIDEFMPAFDFSEHHQMQVRAPVGRVFSAVEAVDLGSSVLVKILFGLRGIPALLREPNVERGFTLDDLTKMGFVRLGIQTDRELLLGVVGKFWTPAGKIEPVERADFATFEEPGYAKATWNFYVSQQKNDWSLLATETRVRCCDEEARKKFARYWTIVRPFSGLIRVEALKVIKRQAEQ